MFNPFNRMPDAHKMELIGVAREVASLEQAPGWKHFVKLAEAFAANQTPHVSAVKGQEHAIEIASQLAFASGVRAAIGLIQQQKDILRSLEK